ncbi:D-glycero-alpha-D-manno-heptose-1,7-bisphosphate 7-phosphatase [bacterium HR33]|nr:D-glycero-alpha-D-manno-heptose-1,7-bisphosphate 7-phosphatase [bacterium HR33]
MLWTVFLDRDGVLNHKLPEGRYVTDWQEFHWIPGSLDALRVLAGSRARIVLVTNQQGVGKGLLTSEQLDGIHRRMQADIAAAGGRVDAVYVCPHLEGSCDCRKPAVGLFLRARRDFPDTSFSHSVVVGDSPSDVEAGKRLGTWTVLIGPPLKLLEAERHATAPDLRAAVERVVLPLLERSGAARE